MSRHRSNMCDSKQAFFMLSICSVVLLIDRISLVRLVGRFLCHHRCAPIGVLPFWFLLEMYPLPPNQSHCVIDLLWHGVWYHKGFFVLPFACPILQSNFLKSLSYFCLQAGYLDSGYLCFGSVIFDRVLEMSQKLTWSIVFAGIAQKHAPSFVWNISSQGILNIKFIWAFIKMPKYMLTAKPCTQGLIHHATYLLSLRLNQSFQLILNTFWALIDR